ncbi:MAG: protein kinase [Polyangiaceae bacterium]
MQHAPDEGAYRRLRDNYPSGPEVLQFMSANDLVPQYSDVLPRARSAAAMFAFFTLKQPHFERFGLANDAVLALLLPHAQQQQWFRQEANMILRRPEFRHRLATTAVLVFSADPRIANKCSQSLLEESGADDDDAPYYRTALVPFYVEDLRKCTSRLERERLFNKAFLEHSFSLDHFDTRAPVPEDLFGRQSLVKALEGDLRYRDAGVALMGIRRVGKTSVLQSVLAELQASDEADRWLVSSYDAQAHGSDASSRALWGLYASLRTACGAAGIGIPNNLGRTPDGLEAQKAIEELTHYVLRAPGHRRIVFAIDEFEHIVPDSQEPSENQVKLYLDIVGTLRAQKQRFKGRVAVIICGINETFTEETHYFRKPNPALDWFKIRYVPPLEDAPFSEMLVTIGRRMGVTFTENGLREIHSMWGGHPYLARQFCSSLLDGRPRPLEVQERDVISSLAGFRRRADTIFRDILTHLGFHYSAEYDSLRALALEIPSSSTNERHIDHLVNYGLVSRRPSETIRICALRDYLRANPDNTGARRFVIHNLIGDGGQGVVHRAYDRETNSICAIKTYPSHANGGKEAAEKEYRLMENAIKIGAGAYVAKPIGVFAHGTQWVLAMEFIEGRTLEDVLREKATLAWPELHKFGSALFAAIEALHPSETSLAGLDALTARDLALIQGEGNRMWHRDIKPHNLIVSGESMETVRVIDFGIASAVQDASRTNCGTFGYLPPDAATRPWDSTFDLYAVGRILWRCQFGDFSEPEHVPEMVAQLHLTGAEEERVVSFFQCALAASGARRFRSARAMREAWELQVVVHFI